MNLQEGYIEKDLFPKLFTHFEERPYRSAVWSCFRYRMPGRLSPCVKEIQKNGNREGDDHSNLSWKKALRVPPGNKNNDRAVNREITTLIFLSLFFQNDDKRYILYHRRIVS